MKSFMWILVVICTVGLLSGCNSGIMKGAGSDVSKLGNKMQS